MRLDRYLLFIRLVKSRTLAQAMIETGHVRIDGKRVEQASEEVRVGQRHRAAAARRGARASRSRAARPPRPAAEARACYETGRLTSGSAAT